MDALLRSYGGEAAALATSALWAFTAVFFTLASLRIGSYTVNRARLVLAVLFLGISHALVHGSFFPAGAGAEAWLWLGLSGLVGLTLGDTLLFQALVDLGTQRAMLVMASWPILAALMAFAFLGEQLTVRELAGVVLTLSSIAWVVAGGSGRATAGGAPARGLRRGLLLAAGGAACQAAGVLLAKKGLSGGLPALSGTVARMTVAAAGLWIVALFRRDAWDALRRLSADRRGALFTACGAVTGPFLGVWLSLVAVKFAKVGVAAALMSLPPVLLLPIGRWVFKDPLSPRALLGTSGALAGVWLLLLKT